MILLSKQALEARKALARRELRRRGLSSRPINDWKAVLHYFSSDDLERMEALCTQWGGVPDNELPLEVQSEFKAMLLATARTIRESDVPDDRGSTDAELMALVQRLEAKLAAPAVPAA